MIQEYVERKPLRVRAVQWFPGMDFPLDETFNPKIIERDGKHYFCYEDTGHEQRIWPGWFIVDSSTIFGLEVWNPEGFLHDFVEATKIHENDQTVV